MDIIFNKVFKRKLAGFVESGAGGDNGKKQPMLHACPLYERCGMAACNIEEFHNTNCTRYPDLKEEIERTRENQAQKLKI